MKEAKLKLRSAGGHWPQGGAGGGPASQASQPAARPLPSVWGNPSTHLFCAMHRRGSRAQQSEAPSANNGAHPLTPSSSFFAWPCQCDCKAATTMLVVLAIGLAAILASPSDAALVAHAFSSQTRLAMPSTTPFVERREMSLIVDAIESERDYIVVDGGNRVGKSVAVKAAASRLSVSRAVRSSICDESDTAASVLRRLFGLDTASTILSRVLAGAAKLALPAPPTLAEIREIVFSMDALSLEPVFIVEMAERLEVKELKALLDFAKELVDARRGRFVFVFSPTDKLDAIGDFGSISRAKIINVGDLDGAGAAAFMAQLGCSASGASALYALIGGHLPHLVSGTVRSYCSGKSDLAGVEGALLADIDAQIKAVDRAHRGKAACAALCGVLTEQWPEPGLLDALLKKRLAVAALRKGVFVASQMVRAYADLRCHCRL